MWTPSDCAVSMTGHWIVGVVLLCLLQLHISRCMSLSQYGFQSIELGNVDETFRRERASEPKGRQDLNMRIGAETKTVNRWMKAPTMKLQRAYLPAQARVEDPSAALADHKV